MTPPVPPDVLLDHVLTALAGWLPRRFDVLLAADRFADGRAVLARLAPPGGAAAAAWWLHPAEAERLTGLLLERWAALGPVDVPPLAVILGPDQEHPAHRIATYGVEEGWTARWSGPVTPSPDGRSATAPAGATVRARVFASTPSGRTILPAAPQRTARTDGPS